MIRIFPRRTAWTPTDPLSYIGDPPLFRPPEQPVRISVTFTWDKPEGERLAHAWGAYYRDVQVGGPAYNDAGAEFVPGLYVKDGVVITSRGCTKNCPWCFVPTREGRVRELQIKPGWIVQDNNLLACSERHVRGVFEMLREQKRGAKFSGGLDASLFEPWHRTLLDSIRYEELWFACDSHAGIAALRRIHPLLDGVRTEKRRCYVMIGYQGETLLEAERRLENVFEMGFLPFCQLYLGTRRELYSPEWLRLQRKWSRPAAYRGRKTDQ